jgi:hypothetical protein
LPAAGAAAIIGCDIAQERQVQSSHSRRKLLIPLCLFVVYVSNATAGVAQTQSNSDPYSGLSDRLKSLSTFVDRHLQSVETVSRFTREKGLVNKQGVPTTAAKKAPNLSAIKGLEFSETLNSLLTAQNLEPALKQKQINLLQDHQKQLQDFSVALRKSISDVSALPRSEALQRLDAIIVPPTISQMLHFTPDGKPLPSPPHLEIVPAAVPKILSPYVVGPGSAATVDYPSVAEIAYAWAGYGSSGLCTGTLISTTSVLTAAHCFCEFANARTAAACETTYARGLEMVRPTNERFITVFFHDRGPLPVKEIVIHPDFNFPQHDLAILQLKDEILDIMPAPLNSVRPVGPGEYATIVGFGMHSPCSPMENRW